MNLVLPGPSEVACPACRHRGEPGRIPRGAHVYYVCAACGMVVSVRPGEPDEAGRQTTAVPGRRILIADPSEPLRSALRARLTTPVQADTLIECANGFELLAECVRGLCHGERPSLIVADVKLQVLDGKNAAIMLRAVEEAFGMESPTPIVFFSQQPLDDALKRLLAFVGQAHYLHRPAGEGAEELAARLVASMQQA